MAKNKATHKGTCQCCGRLQKLPGNLLSLHGYTVDWGYFNGTCGGASKLPLEIDRSELDLTVKILREHAEDLDTMEPVKVHVGPARSIRRVGRGRGCRRVTEGGEVNFNDFEAFRTLALESLAKWHNCGWRQGFDYSTIGTTDKDRLVEEYGSIDDQNEREIMHKYAYARKVAINALRQKARHYRQHADMLTKLADKVHGQPLKEIKKAS